MTEIVNAPECAKCDQHRQDNPDLVRAATTAGMKLGWGVGTVLGNYLAAFHRNGHKDETGRV